MTATATGPVTGRQRPRRRGIWLAVAAATATALILPALAALVAVVFRHQQDVPVTYHRPVTTLQVTTPGAVVTVAPGPPGQVTVVRFLTWRLGPPPRVATAWAGRALRVTVPECSGKPLRWCSTRVVIRVPAGTALRASVGDGQLTATALTGPLQLRATSGVIILNGVSGPVWARAASGMISGAGLTAARVDAAVTSGNLGLRFAVAPQRVSAVATSGIVTVGVPPGARYQVLGSAPGGVWDVQRALVSRRSPRLIAAGATGGSVSVRYGPAPAARPAPPVSPAPPGS